MKQNPQPAIFFGHGSPMNAIQETEFSLGWRNLGQKIIQNKPNAVLMVSAHWITDGTKITVNEYPPTIHDFGGFPRDLYRVEYPAPGSRELAESIIDTTVGFSIEPDDSWGLDHGTWSILKWVFPYANIPILQLSIDRNLTMQGYFELGKALAHWREEGVLLAGSGNLVHNLSLLNWQNLDEEPEWAVEANDTMKVLVHNRNVEELAKANAISPYVNLAINSAEHFVPALYCLGFGEGYSHLEFFNDRIQSSLSMTGFILSEGTTYW